MVCFNIITYFCRVSRNSNKKLQILLFRIFSPEYFFLCVAMTSRNTNKNEGLLLSFHHKTTTKRQFQLPKIILHQGNGASFKTNSFQPVRVIKIAIESIGTTKGALITSSQATSEIKLNSNLCRLKLMLTSSIVSDTDYHQSLQREKAHFGQIITL